MNKKDIAQMIGVSSRQHIDFVLTGKRNFSYTIAKKAVLVIGGSLDVWMDKDNTKVRKELWTEFAKKANGGQK